MGGEGERTDEEVRKMLEEAAKKPVVHDEGVPIVPPEITKENVENKGQVWKKKKQPTKKTKTPS